jgi:hypothetical protein
MDGFDHILNWKLRHGSHRFPGKDGGTCINEATVVAAGSDYRPIRRVEDMPECDCEKLAAREGCDGATLRVRSEIHDKRANRRVSSMTEAA